MESMGNGNLEGVGKNRKGKDISRTSRLDITTQDPFCLVV